MHHPDQKYIKALLDNDKLIIDELYKKYSSKIKCMVLQNSGTESDAADVFQESLLSIFNKAKSGNFILTCPFDAFFYLICRNKWMNELNKRKTRKITFMDSDQYNNIGEDNFKVMQDCMLKEERKKLLMEKLNELGESSRKLLLLSWSGKPMEEVARILNLTYGYVRKKKCECMARLVTRIKESSKFNSLKL